MQPNKTLLGFLTILPFIGAIVLGIWGFTVAMEIVAMKAAGDVLSEEEVLQLILTDFVSIFVIGMALGLMSLGLTIYYIVLVINNKKMEGGLKILWVILIFIFSGVAKLIYFFAVVVPMDYNEPIQEEKVRMV